MKVPAQIPALLVAAIILTSILTGCATQQNISSKPKKTRAPLTVVHDISGEWQIVDSTARFKISFVDGAVHIEGWDSSTGEKFRISDAQWDGKKLSGIFVLPSKNVTAYYNLVLIDANTLKGMYTGDSSGQEVWKRQAVIAASTPTVSAMQQKNDTQPSEAGAPITPGEDISGEWQVVDSTARFKISFVDGVIQIEGWDSSTGEKFRISDAQWNGKKLSGIFVLPSKNVTAYYNLVLIDANTFKGTYTGDSSGQEVWKRQSVIAASTPTGSALQEKIDTQPSEASAPITAGEDISGEWQVVDSTARFKISFVEGAIHIEGWDSSTGEKFRISDAQWNGKRLSGIFVLPSKNVTAYDNLVLIDANTLKGMHTGDSSGQEVWKRQSVIAASAPTGSTLQEKIDTQPSEAGAPITAGEDISGEWQVVDSTARFKISFVDGVIQIEGWDTSDGEKFRIADVQWNGKRLSGIFVMPSTNGTTFSDLVLIDPNTLKGIYKGDSTGQEVWKRQ